MQEEQKVIEAQIRIRQQEIQDEAKKLKKIQDISSSSRIMNPADVEYCDIGSSSISGPFSTGYVVLHYYFNSGY